MRTRTGSGKYFFGWHTVERFGVPTRVRVEVYVAVPEVWVDLEPSSLPNVPSPAVMSKLFSNRIPSGGATHARDIWSVARSELAVAFLISYLAACRDGVSKSLSTDPRIEKSYLFVFVPIQPAII